MPPSTRDVLLAKVEIHFWSVRAGLMDRRIYSVLLYICTGWCRVVIDYADRQSDAWEIIFSWESSQASAGMWNEWDSHL